MTLPRRRLLAGVGGAAVVGGGWALASDRFELTETATVDFTVDTIDAPGSSEGTLSVPTADRPTLIDFVSVGCAVCRESMPALRTIYDQHGEAVRFVSLSTDPVGFSVAESSLREWWADHEGAWALGIDRQLSVAEQLDVSSVPTAVVIDHHGRVRTRQSGTKTVDKLESLLEPVL